MLQNTMKRLAGIEEISCPVVVCNEEHRFMTAEQLRSIGITADEIILEPIGKNTAPAITVAALKAAEKHEDPVLLVLPADHVIADTGGFHQAIRDGLEYADKGNLITFGIVPDSPETGYGYIKKGHLLSEKTVITRIEKFVEKPDLETARQYVESGFFCWNSGMFMFKASGIIHELENHAPEMLELCREVVADGKRDLDFFRLDFELFNRIPADSIDYAVMEKTLKGVMIPLDVGWNDLGSFDALWQTNEKDENRNVFKGDVLIQDVKDSFISSESRLVTAVGLEKFVIVYQPRYYMNLPAGKAL